jgi:uncharacterized protein (DUF2249 family)
MNEIMNDTFVDVRDMAPRERHPAIFKTWAGLSDGAALVLVNDHDPLPLYYQLACEHTGTFRWEYLEQGPITWRVKLTRGKFADPGFKPVPKCACPEEGGLDFSKPVVVDVRPIFARGETPCQVIEDAAAQTPAGKTFELLVPFEPMPLYAKLGRDGFTYKSTRQADGSFKIEFTKGS